MSLSCLNLYWYAAQRCSLIKTKDQSFPFIHSLESLDFHLDFFLQSSLKSEISFRHFWGGDQKTLRIFRFQFIFVGLMFDVCPQFKLSLSQANIFAVMNHFLIFLEEFNPAQLKTQFGCDRAFIVDNTFVYFAAVHRPPVPFRIYFNFILLSLVGLGPYQRPYLVREITPTAFVLFFLFFPFCLPVAVWYWEKSNYIWNTFVYILILH